MPGRDTAPKSGKALEDRVKKVARELGLKVNGQVEVGRRIWGAKRHIDVIISNAQGRRLGVECKFQGKKGTAEEKIPAIINDISAWPIDGLVVFDGDGFTPNMESYLISTGKAIHLSELHVWLVLFFGLDLKETLFD